jgi:hypothetical protein
MTTGAHALVSKHEDNMIKMKRSRNPKLQVSAERIRELTADQLGAAAGACDTTSYTTDPKTTHAAPGG